MIEKLINFIKKLIGLVKPAPAFPVITSKVEDKAPVEDVVKISKPTRTSSKSKKHLEV